VETICSRAIYLENGRVIDAGDAAPVVAHYTADVTDEANGGAPEPLDDGANLLAMPTELLPR
jgi:hypothetical protein